MIAPAYVRAMARYNRLMNERWYAAAAKLTDDQRKADRGAFFGSLHATLCHLVWADQMWMSRFAGWDKPKASGKDSSTFEPDFTALRDRRAVMDAALEDWAGGVDEDWLAGDLVWFSGIAQKEMRGPRAMLVTHMFNHQTHHRGQAHCLLTQFGEDPGVTDLGFVL